MPVIRLRCAAVCAIASLMIGSGSSALARPSASSEPARPASFVTPLLLRADDVPGLVVYPSASGPLSLWESAEREHGERVVLRQNGWRRSARRTYGQSPTSLYGVLVVESRALVFANPRGARRALAQLTVAGLHRVAGPLPIAGGAQVFAHLDTVSGISELALATQFRQRNVISRVMIVGTPGIINRAHLLATARRQAMHVAQTLSAAE